MEPYRKAAYRHLIYRAMLDIRSLAWIEPRPDVDVVQEARRAGRVADWMHNLALFSQADFAGFREDWFWAEYQQLCADVAGFDRCGYKDRFDRTIRENDDRGGDPRGPS